MTLIHYIIIADLIIGFMIGYKIANKAYDQFKSKHDPTMYEVRFKFIAKSIDSIVWGLAFIIGTLLWPLGLLELIGDRKK